MCFEIKKLLLILWRVVLLLVRDGKFHFKKVTPPPQIFTLQIIRMSSLAQLHLNEPLPWLKPNLVQDPLLLCPGEGDSVAIEAGLLLATSPFLRTLATSTPSCSCSSLVVILPSTTYQVKPCSILIWCR